MSPATSREDSATRKHAYMRNCGCDACNREWLRRSAPVNPPTGEREGRATPEYRFKGRTYKTVNGLSRAIFDDCGCDSHSMIINRVITATVGRREQERVVARYEVSAPEVGKPMAVIRL